MNKGALITQTTVGGDVAGIPLTKHGGYVTMPQWAVHRTLWLDSAHKVDWYNYTLKELGGKLSGTASINWTIRRAWEEACKDEDKAQKSKIKYCLPLDFLL